jgi:hypothetical protein
MLKKIIYPLVFGIIAAACALFLEVGLTLFPIWSNKETSGISAFLLLIICVEETAKFLFLRQYLNQQDLVRTFPMPALFFGFGFFLADAASFFLGTISGDVSEKGLVLLGFLGVFTVHIATSILLGRSVLGFFRKEKFRPALFLIFALAVHFFYNLFVLSDLPRSLILIYFFVLLGLLGHTIAQNIRENKAADLQSDKY